MSGQHVGENFVIPGEVRAVRFGAFVYGTTRTAP